MKFSMDETMKHRIIGVTVVISIAAVFVPAMLKKSSQRMDNQKIAIHLPQRPERLNHHQIDEEKTFNSVKVAHVELPSVDDHRENSDYLKARALGAPEPLSVAETHYESALNPVDDSNRSSIEAKADQRRLTVPDNHGSISNAPNRQEFVVKKTPVVIPAPVKKINTAKLGATQKSGKQLQKPAAPSNHFAVQIGVFTDERNAKKLVSVMKSKGYSAQKVVINQNQSKIYKVLVGDSANRQQAETLKKKLLKQSSIKGFIVQKGVA